MSLQTLKNRPIWSHCNQFTWKYDIRVVIYAHRRFIRMTTKEVSKIHVMAITELEVSQFVRRSVWPDLAKFCHFDWNWGIFLEWILFLVKMLTCFDNIFAIGQIVIVLNGHIFDVISIHLVTLKEVRNH